MKSIRYLFLICLTAVSIFACEELKNLVAVEKGYEVGITMPIKTTPGSGVALSNPINSDLQEIFDENNLNADNAKVTLKSLSARIELPETATFKDLSELDVFLIANGKSTKIAWNSAIPETAGFSLKFEVDSEVDLLSFLLEDKIQFRVAYTTRSAIDESYLFRLNSTFEIGPK